jgi:hypothetical protein
MEKRNGMSYYYNDRPIANPILDNRRSSAAAWKFTNIISE